MTPPGGRQSPSSSQQQQHSSSSNTNSKAGGVNRGGGDGGKGGGGGDARATLREINNKMIFWGKQKDFTRVLQLLDQFTSQGLRPNIYTLNALINAAVLCHRSEEETRRIWKDMMDNYGIRPTAVTYNILLKRYFGSRR